MKTAFIISAIAACYAFFATSKMLPQFVHDLCSRGYDKHAHCLIFFVLEIVSVLVFPKIPPLSIAAVLAIIGCIVEVLQGFTGRNACMLDVFSNCAGLFFALIFIHCFNYLTKINFSL